MGEVTEKASGGGRESEATGTPHPRKPRKTRQGFLFVLARRITTVVNRGPAYRIRAARAAAGERRAQVLTAPAAAWNWMQAAAAAPRARLLRVRTPSLSACVISQHRTRQGSTLRQLLAPARLCRIEPPASSCRQREGRSDHQGGAGAASCSKARIPVRLRVRARAGHALLRRRWFVTAWFVTAPPAQADKQGSRSRAARHARHALANMVWGSAGRRLAPVPAQRLGSRRKSRRCLWRDAPGATS